WSIVGIPHHRGSGRFISHRIANDCRMKRRLGVYARAGASDVKIRGRRHASRRMQFYVRQQTPARSQLEYRDHEHVRGDSILFSN
ncbi:hypothetical protein AURDEDRAFT_115382, partial [Auricularia subglabra TFB-10046 SS5]